MHEAIPRGPAETECPSAPGKYSSIRKGQSLRTGNKLAAGRIADLGTDRLTNELFDKPAEEVEERVDTIAERAIQLGGVAHGTIQEIQSKTKLPAYPTGIFEGSAHVAALSDSYAAFGKAVREAIESADKAGDKDTSDLFTQVSRAADKALWFIEAHNQSATVNKAGYSVSISSQ